MNRSFGFVDVSLVIALVAFIVIGGITSYYDNGQVQINTEEVR